MTKNQRVVKDYSRAASDAYRIAGAPYEEQISSAREKRAEHTSAIVEIDALVSCAKREMRIAQAAAQSEITRQFREELETATFGDALSPQTKLDQLFDLAWGNGHSSGYEEVARIYEETADLIRSAE